MPTIFSATFIPIITRGRHIQCLLVIGHASGSLRLRFAGVLPAGPKTCLHPNRVSHEGRAAKPIMIPPIPAEASRLERAFRDIYTGSQHAFINEKTYTDSAKILMGLIEDAPGV